MSEITEHVMTGLGRRGRSFRIRPVAIVLAPLAAILFEVYLPRFFGFLSWLELPLLVTVYFSLMRRSQVAGTFIGAGVGLAQDSLSHQPLGMFGIVKTLVGYFAGSVSTKFDVSNHLIRFVLSFFFFVFHQFLYWVLERALLGQAVALHVRQMLLLALLNSAVALPLFMLLDRIEE